MFGGHLYETGLKEGDVCVFVLIDKILFEAFFHRKTEAAHWTLLPGK